mmetsp:Transcript_4966/g.14067  ORF Transcript_4966/g.14067 Transcript_4966/m.14067 type:complete len:476 (+) Transcript_4966:837-2264(+)
MSPPCSNASGIMVWAIIVSIAPAARPSTPAMAVSTWSSPLDPGGKSSAPRPAPTAVTTVVAAHIRRILGRLTPWASMLPEELMLSGRLLMKTPMTKGSAVAADCRNPRSPSSALLLIRIPMTKDSGTASMRMPSHTMIAAWALPESCSAAAGRSAPGWPSGFTSRGSRTRPPLSASCSQTSPWATRAAISSTSLLELVSGDRFDLAVPTAASPSESQPRSRPTVCRRSRREGCSTSSASGGVRMRGAVAAPSCILACAATTSGESAVPSPSPRGTSGMMLTSPGRALTLSMSGVTSTSPGRGLTRAVADLRVAEDTPTGGALAVLAARSAGTTGTIAKGPVPRPASTSSTSMSSDLARALGSSRAKLRGSTRSTDVGSRARATRGCGASPRRCSVQRRSLTFTTWRVSDVARLTSIAPKMTEIMGDCSSTSPWNTSWPGWKVTRGHLLARSCATASGNPFSRSIWRRFSTARRDT